MKCGLLVLWKDVRRRGSGELYRKAARWYGAGHAVPDDEKAMVERCDGAIEARVEAVDEPYYGGCSASLIITYKCDTCGGQWYPHLPSDADSLSAFLTRAIAVDALCCGEPEVPR